MKSFGEKLYGNYTKTLRTVFNKFFAQLAGAVAYTNSFSAEG